MRKRLALFCLAAFSLGAEDLKGRFDEIAKSRLDNKTFMGTVLVAKGEQVLSEKAFGSADLEWDASTWTSCCKATISKRN